MIELLDPKEWHKLDSIFESEFNSAIPDSQHASIIADVEDGELRGFIVVESLVWVGQIYIAPNHRGNGLTRKFIRHIEDKTRKACRSVITIASEPRFEKLFQRKKMRKVGCAVYRKEMY